MAIYWSHFDLPKNQGHMTLHVNAETKLAATKITSDKAAQMSSKWKHRLTVCIE